MGEVVCHKLYQRRDEAKSNHRIEETYEEQYQFLGFNVHKVIVAIYCVYGAFILGLVINQVSTDVVKYMVGRLRPHYLAVCKPDWSSIACTHPQTGQPQYIDDPNVCTGTDEKHIKEARYVHLYHIIIINTTDLSSNSIL